MEIGDEKEASRLLRKTGFSNEASNGVKYTIEAYRKRIRERKKARKKRK